MIRELKLRKDKDSYEKKMENYEVLGGGQGFLKNDMTRKHYIG